MPAKKTVVRFCENCGNEFRTSPCEINRGKGKVCSLACAAALASRVRDQKGAANNNWRGGYNTSTNLDRKQKYRRDNPQKYAAQLAITHALRKGTIAPLPCEQCGNPRTEAHHDDYSKPLEVRWLCKHHHLLAHNGRFGN